MVGDTSAPDVVPQDTSAPDVAPQDSGAPPSDADASATGPLAEPIVLITQLVHLEGWQTSDPEVFDRYVALLRERADLYERHGARLTLESKELTPGAVRWGARLEPREPLAEEQAHRTHPAPERREPPIMGAHGSTSDRCRCGRRIGS